MLAPGLAEPFRGLAEDAWPAAPALSRWLSRARTRVFPALGSEQAALSLFDVSTFDDDLPIAPFSYLGDTDRVPQGHCWCADLVHLRVDTRGLILFEAAACRLRPEEQQALFTLLRDFLVDAGWSLEAGHSLRWYLRRPEVLDLQTTPLSGVRGKPVAEHLPRGRDATEWLKRSNEMQMLLHDHPVNRERAARGLPTLNSLWISGGGRLPEPRRNRFSRLHGEGPLLRGLGLWSGAATAAPPESAQALVAALQSGERALLLLDGLELPAAYGDLPQWRALVERYERLWFEPLVHALSRGRLRRLTLMPLNGQRYRLSRADLWRFWRRHPWRLQRPRGTA